MTPSTQVHLRSILYLVALILESHLFRSAILWICNSLLDAAALDWGMRRRATKTRGVEYAFAGIMRMPRMPLIPFPVLLIISCSCYPGSRDQCSLSSNAGQLEALTEALMKIERFIDNEYLRSYRLLEESKHKAFAEALGKDYEGEELARRQDLFRQTIFTNRQEVSKDPDPVGGTPFAVLQPRVDGEPNTMRWQLFSDYVDALVSVRKQPLPWLQDGRLTVPPLSVCETHFLLFQVEQAARTNPPGTWRYSNEDYLRHNHKTYLQELASWTTEHCSEEGFSNFYLYHGLETKLRPTFSEPLIAQRINQDVLANLPARPERKRRRVEGALQAVRRTLYLSDEERKILWDEDEGGEHFFQERPGATFAARSFSSDPRTIGTCGARSASRHGVVGSRSS